MYSMFQGLTPEAEVGLRDSWPTLQEQTHTVQSYACTGHEVRGSETDGHESTLRWTPSLDK
jgi:hypothetical protein